MGNSIQDSRLASTQTSQNPDNADDDQVKVSFINSIPVIFLCSKNSLKDKSIIFPDFDTGSSAADDIS